MQKLFAPPHSAEAIRAAIAANPMGALEDIAAAANTQPGAVLDHLPADEVSLAPGSAFVEVMRDLTDWGDVTVVLNTGPVIFEAKGVVPRGSIGRGFYNLHGAPIGGHIKADACDRVAFVSRKFMGVETHSIQFYTAGGACMFKVYLGRDADRQMHPDQIARFTALRDRLSAQEVI
jgi:putative heme utilization carrier protein HutX